MRKRSLGRGLSQLLSGDTPPESRAVVEIAVADIKPNPRQPRKMGEMIEDVELEQLAQSIDAHGILQPVIVRRRGEGYELVAGERRWRAAKLLAMPTMPCIVQDIDDHTALQLALVENLQREDLNEMEVAEGYRALIDEFGATQEEVAQYVGKSRSAVTNALRLLDLPAEIQNMVREGSLSAGHGRALLGLGREDMEGVVRVAKSVVGQGMSVRETEQLVRDLLSFRDVPEDDGKEPASSSTQESRDPHVAEAEERLQSLLATRVMIKRRAKGGGTIEIRYYDDDDLCRIVDELEAGGDMP
jgi:ParB family transcriptional regulator, chromosome partitioning protein